MARRLEQGDYENPLFDPSWSGGLNVRFVCARDAHEAEALLGALPPGVVVA